MPNNNKHLNWHRTAARWLAAGVALVAGSAQAATLQVNPSGADSGDCQVTACQTITYALNQAATSGDTIQVAAGAYTEELTISKSVTIVGAGSANTIIQAPAVLISNPVVPDSSGAKTAIVFVTGAITTATMRNLQVRGPGPAGPNQLGYGIFVGGGADFTLDHARVTAIRDNPLSGNQHGVGIRFGSPSTGQVSSGQVLDSVIDDFQKNGMTISGAGSSVTVRGNTVTGTQPPPIIAQNGIQVSSGAVALVENNTISNLQCSTSNPSCGPNGYWSVGILLFGSGAGTVVKDNTVSNSDANLAIAGGSASVENNTFTNGIYANVMAQGGATLNMTGNILTGAPVGLLATGGGTVQGHQNQIYNNTEGVTNDPAAPATMDLSCNWWGDQTGPTHTDNPLGTGDSSSANVTYTNWAINNSNFVCVGNPARNEVLAQPPAPVPADAPWALISAALALAGLGAGALQRQRRG